MPVIIKPQPLTKEAFSVFGDVIETADSDYFMINNNNTQRYHNLAQVQLSSNNDNAIISIFRAKALEMPLKITMMERHPKGSQAFIPLKENPFLILVAAAGKAPDTSKIKAFLTNGLQGINYHTGVWHHPILCCAEEDDFLVVDRQGDGNNCDEHFYPTHSQAVLDIS